MTAPLTRENFGRPAAPVRIVHIGLGNFTRAHQAWYTEHASDADQWGIAAFTGRRPTMAELLTPQDGLYTLITKEPDGDSYEIISSISKVHPASDLQGLLTYFTDPEVAVVTITVTEAGYYIGNDGGLDKTHDAIAADLDALRSASRAGDFSPAALSATEVKTTPVKILAGLLARRAAGAGPITVLPCDNLPDSGPTIHRGIREAAEVVEPGLLQWLETNVSWATSMVDRITPATTETELAGVRETQGYDDAAPVPTEPFSEWVISGEFIAGRPDWVGSGAQIVEHVEPYEQRKLWMLNGSHTLMAYAGPILGCETVSQAIAHPTIRGWVQEWWAAAGPQLSVSWEDYAEALLDRFSNPNIRHLLAQIAPDGSVKIPVRIAPTLRSYRREGVVSTAAVRVIAAWLLHLAGHGVPVKDAAGQDVASLAAGSLEDGAARVVGHVAPELAGDPEVVAAVVRAAQEILDAAAA